MHNAVEVEIVPTGTDPGEWSARINGLELPLASFGVEPADDGRVFVSLVVEASSFKVGKRTAAPAAQAAQDAAKVGVWGDPSVPDPRESLPGWSRPLSADVATRQSATAKLGELE